MDFSGEGHMITDIIAYWEYLVLMIQQIDA